MCTMNYKCKYYVSVFWWRGLSQNADTADALDGKGGLSQNADMQTLDTLKGSGGS